MTEVDVSRRDLLLSVLGLTGGFAAARSVQEGDEQALLPAGGDGDALRDLISDLQHVVVGDDPDSLLASLNQFPKLMLDSSGNMRLLERYETGTEVLTLDNTGQLVISDTLEQAKNKVDRYPALVVVRGSGATLIEES